MTLITYDIHNGYVATGPLFFSILTRLSLYYETLLYEWLAAKKQPIEICLLPVVTKQGEVKGKRKTTYLRNFTRAMVLLR